MNLLADLCLPLEKSVPTVCISLQGNKGDRSPSMMSGLGNCVGNLGHHALLDNISSKAVWPTNRLQAISDFGPLAV
jgi:hypothetical protein